MRICPLGKGLSHFACQAPLLTHLGFINPLSPNSDQHEFSPNNIHMLPLREIVMRVNKMSIIEKMLICHQSLSTNSSKKCMKISMEKLYVDIGA